MADLSGDRRNALKGRKDRKATSPTKPVAPDLRAIMERFSQALSLAIVCHRSLAAQPSAGVGDEEETLRRAIRLLQDVYNEIDLVPVVVEGKPR